MREHLFFLKSLSYFLLVGGIRTQQGTRTQYCCTPGTNLPPPIYLKSSGRTGISTGACLCIALSTLMIGCERTRMELFDLPMPRALCRAHRDAPSANVPISGQPDVGGRSSG